MAAVIAAIAAGFLAGFVALFREHRIQERQLLVAARVVDESLTKFSVAISVTLESNDWKPFNSLSTAEQFENVWETFRGDLAGHLEWKEWVKVETAVVNCEAIRQITQENPPQEVDSLLGVKAFIATARGELARYREKRFSLLRQFQRWRGLGDWKGC